MPVFVILLLLSVEAVAQQPKPEPAWKRKCRRFVEGGVQRTWQPELPPIVLAPDRCNGELDIFAAAELDCPERILQLVAQGTDANAPSETGERPLQAAARKKSAAAVKALLESGADPNAPARGDTPLCRGVASPEIVAALLAAGAESDVPECRAAAMAAKYGNAETLGMILAHSEVDLEERNRFGLAAFYQAMHEPSLEMPKMLLEHGAEVDGTDSAGQTPLFHYNSGAKGCFLLLNGANPNHRSNDGSTPLMYAAQRRRVESVERLVAAGADVNARADDGSTPLMFAAQWGRVDAIDLLVAAGADINAKDDAGNSAFVYALRTSWIPPSEIEPTGLRLLELGATCDGVKIYREPIHEYAAKRGWHALLNAMEATGCAERPPVRF